MPAVAAMLVIAAIILATASAPREALARWFRQAIGLSAQPAPRPMLAGLPGAGQLLVNSPAGPWIVHGNGSRRYLGRYTAAAWSPHSLYVVAWRGVKLVALNPQGRPQWAIDSPARVTVARWSPDGYRIAYSTGSALRIVSGDGSSDHQLDPGTASTTPAWQPHTGQQHRIAYLDRHGYIELRDADTRALRWRAKPVAAPQQLLWSADGTHLLTIALHRLSLYNVHGQLTATSPLPVGDTAGPAAITTGNRLAVVLHQASQPADSIDELDATKPGLQRAPQTLFTAPERITGIDWSPNHQWLLTSSPTANQWIFIHALAPTRLTAVSEIANQFRRDGKAAPGTPELAGWQP